MLTIPTLHGKGEVCDESMLKEAKVQASIPSSNGDLYIC